jgi:tetratricopeptide (TPR) repeat protein
MKNVLKTALCLLFLFWGGIFFSQRAFAQILQTSSPVFNNFQFEIIELEIKAGEIFQKKDFKQAEILWKEILILTENIQLRNEDVPEVRLKPFLYSVKSNAYYNLACSQAQLNNKKEAINSLEKAVEFGYSEYHYAKKDSNLDNLRKDKGFIALLDTMKFYDKLSALQNAGSYKHDSICSLPKFSYQPSEFISLSLIKAYFGLEAIAGDGDEISKIKNLLFFVTHSTGYDPAHWCPCEFDAIDIFNYCQATGRGVNCKNKAIMMNEIFLAMGFKSRYITCLPKDPKDSSNHVINSVYSKTLKKWLYMDPSFGIYVTDENDNMLSVSEVRERLKNGLPLALNKEAEYRKEWYLNRYMAKTCI